VDGDAEGPAGEGAAVRTLKVALLGCGGVGSEVYRLLGRQAADLEARIGAPLEVYARPATTFVAGFIGSPPMNLIPRERDGRKVLFGIRPEHISVTSEERADMILTVAAVETLGADTLAHCRMAANDKGSDFVLRVPGMMPVYAGQRLPVMFDRKAVHFFDVKTRNRLF